MDGIALITSRIAQIQGTIAALSPAPVSATAAAFDGILAAQLTGAPATATPSAGTLTADGVPTELAAYGNGEIPPSALAEIGDTGHRLWAPATAAYDALSAAAARDGVSITITDSYRSYDSQVDLAERKGLYSQGGLAAAPGTSDHGWGRSLDLGLDTKALTWMRANAQDYGFAEDTPRESWHWTYTPPS